MKQTILSKCFSKVKRVALALFAALCVGSVWGANRGVFWSAPPTVSLSPTGLITITDANNYTWNQSNSGLTKDQYNTAVNNLKCTDTMDYTLHTVDGQEITKTVTVKAQYAVNSVGWHGINIDLGGPYTYQIEDWAAYQISSVDIRFTAALNKTVSSTIDYENLANRQTFAYDYTFEMKGVLSTSSTWDADSSKFVITGDALDSSVRVKYAIGGDELTASSELATVVDVEVSGTAYRLEIPYTDETKLVYSVYAIDGDTESVFVNVEGKSVFVLKKWDNARVTYTWASESAGNWTDPKNWTPDITPAYGYPGTKGEKYFFTSVRFESDAEVNLENGTYTLKDGGASLYFASGANVLLKNGNLGLMPEGMGDNEYALGGNGAVVEYRDVKLIYSAENSGHFNLAFAAGSTNIFAGSISHPWNYLPLYANTKLVFKDGVILTEYSNSGFGNLSSQEVEINNAKWTIKVNNCSDGAKSGIAGLVKFRDGADRQAQLYVDGGRKLKLLGTYDFVLPATPYETAYVEAGTANAVEESFNVRVDASNISGECKVSLIKFSAADDATKTAMKAVADNAAKLQVVVDGEVVDNASRNAKLVWDEAAKTLYYQQGVAASIGDAKYLTLEAAIDAAGEGDTVKLVADIELTSYLPITKSLTLDLGTNIITRMPVSASSAAVLYINNADAEVTITATTGGITGPQAVWANAGTVTIEGGVFAGLDGEAAYVKNTGKIIIKGGTFSASGDVTYVINQYDASRATSSISVMGGRFYDFNPANNGAEGAGTNFCAEGYVATLGEDGYYTVAEQPVKPVAPGAEGSVTVSASTEDEALEKVKLSVTVPDVEGLEADTYKGYFALKATDNQDGTWTVAAVLDDTKVKPVISTEKPAITFEDGKVTVNVDNELPGLYYGVRYATTVEAVETTAPVAGLTVTPAEGDTAGFFKVVVDFKEIQ